MTSVCRKSLTGQSQGGPALEQDCQAGAKARVWRLVEVDSCLDTAFGLCGRDMLAEWESVQVCSQRCGRGQLRRQWHSPPGNIYAALRLPVHTPFDGTAAASAVALLLALALRDLGWQAMIKWPNDLVLACADGPRKAGGILLEERGQVLLAGLGLNVRHAPPDTLLRADAALPAVSLRDQNPKPVRSHALGHMLSLPEALWPRLVKRMVSAYNNGHSFSEQWRPQAEELLLWRGQDVEWHDDQHRIHGRLLGLNPEGGVRLLAGGRHVDCLSGSLRPAGLGDGPFQNGAPAFPLR